MLTVFTVFAVFAVFAVLAVLADWRNLLAMFTVLAAAVLTMLAVAMLTMLSQMELGQTMMHAATLTIARTAAIAARDTSGLEGIAAAALIELAVRLPNSREVAVVGGRGATLGLQANAQVAVGGGHASIV